MVEIDVSGNITNNASPGTFEARALERKKESTKKKRQAVLDWVCGAVKAAAGEDEGVSNLRTKEVAGMAKTVGNGWDRWYWLVEAVGGRVVFVSGDSGGEGDGRGRLRILCWLLWNTESLGRAIASHRREGGGEGGAEVMRCVEANEREMGRKKSVPSRVNGSGYSWMRAENGFRYLRTE
jgi:hypothetical protein